MFPFAIQLAIILGPYHHPDMNMRHFFWGVLVCVAIVFLLMVGSASGGGEETPAVSEESYSALMTNEVLDVQDLAEGAEIQRRMFNRITPAGFSWCQPMFPSIAPFDSKYFEESFLDGLLGADTNSVAVYPLSLVLDPKTRETLVYNAEGKLIASVPSSGVSRTWLEDADPSRVILKLDLLPNEDAEQYLYTEERIKETLAARAKSKPPRNGIVGRRSMGGDTNAFGISNIQHLTNGNVRLTVARGTNDVDIAEVYAYTVWHTSTVTTNEWEDEYGVTNIGTNTLWAPVSPTFNGLENSWDCQTTNLVLTNGTSEWEDSDISSNARVRFYGVANYTNSDSDGLSDGAEIFVYHTVITNVDTDGDGLLDGHDVTVDDEDSRYDLWAAAGITYVDADGLRTFKGEIEAGTDPLAADTDGDGMADGWEVANGLDPLTNDGALDEDGDELSNQQEYIFRTSPDMPDTDQDGLTDGEEVFAGLDPLYNPLLHRQTGWTFYYDDQNRLTAMTSAVAGVSMSYDDAGNLTTNSCVEEE